MPHDIAWENYMNLRKMMINAIKSHSHVINDSKTKNKVQKFILREDERLMSRCLMKMSYVRNPSCLKYSSDSSVDNHSPSKMHSNSPTKN